jgi:hypothetical protein
MWAVIGGPLPVGYAAAGRVSASYSLRSTHGRLAARSATNTQSGLPPPPSQTRSLRRRSVWWAAIGLDPIQIALGLWSRSGAGQRQVLEGGFLRRPTVAGHSEATDAQTSESNASTFRRRRKVGVSFHLPIATVCRNRRLGACPSNPKSSFGATCSITKTKKGS